MPDHRETERTMELAARLVCDYCNKGIALYSSAGNCYWHQGEFLCSAVGIWAWLYRFNASQLEEEPNG